MYLITLELKHVVGLPCAEVIVELIFFFEGVSSNYRARQESSTLVATGSCFSFQRKRKEMQGEGGLQTSKHLTLGQPEETWEIIDVGQHSTNTKHWLFGAGTNKTRSKRCLLQVEKGKEPRMQIFMFIWALPETSSRTPSYFEEQQPVPSYHQLRYTQD